MMVHDLLYDGSLGDNQQGMASGLFGEHDDWRCSLGASR